MALVNIVADNRRVGILFLALTVVKLLVLLFLVASHHFSPFLGDNALDHYVPSAHRMLAEGRFNGPESRPDSKVAPGYSLALAAAMAVAPRRFDLVIVCVQILGDLATALMLAAIGRRFVSPACGALAGAIWLLFPPALAISTWITAETLFTTSFVACVTLLLFSLASQSPGVALTAGLVLGAATLLRATTVILPAVMLVYLARRRVWRLGVCFMVGFVLVLAPWSIRNLVVLKDPILVSVGFGSAFLQGADERIFTIDGKRAVLSDVYADATRAGIVKPATDHESEIDGWLFAVGRHLYQERVSHAPWSFATLLGKKALMLWYATESGTSRAQLILGLCSLPIVIPGVLQLWAWRARRDWLPAILGISVLYFAGLHLATVSLNRYMLPVYPLLCLPASAWWLQVVNPRAMLPVPIGMDRARSA